MPAKRSRQAIPHMFRPYGLATEVVRESLWPPWCRVAGRRRSAAIAGHCLRAERPEAGDVGHAAPDVVHGLVLQSAWVLDKAASAGCSVECSSGSAKRLSEKAIRLPSAKSRSAGAPACAVDPASRRSHQRPARAGQAGRTARRSGDLGIAIVEIPEGATRSSACYRAPEIVLGDHGYGGAADVWSWGVMQWEPAHARRTRAEIRTPTDQGAKRLRLRRVQRRGRRRRSAIRYMLSACCEWVLVQTPAPWHAGRRALPAHPSLRQDARRAATARWL